MGNKHRHIHTISSSHNLHITKLWTFIHMYTHTHTSDLLTFKIELHSCHQCKMIWITFLIIFKFGMNVVWIHPLHMKNVKRIKTNLPSSKMASMLKNLWFWNQFYVYFQPTSLISHRAYVKIMSDGFNMLSPWISLKIRWSLVIFGLDNGLSSIWCQTII